MKLIHIAGTNGKGSVAEYISSILIAAGKRTGCFTSPHLVSPTERLCIDGREIDMRDLDELMDEVKRSSLAVNDTLFAQYFAAAMLWFEQEACEYAVIETGIGGKHDATNIITPALCVLTPISVDHTDILGHTVQAIARDKCGIIKRNVPVVSAMQDAPVRKIIWQTADRRGTTLTFAGQPEIDQADLHGISFKYGGVDYEIGSINLAHADIACTAIEAAKRLRINDDAIVRGIAKAAIICRAQVVKGRPQMMIDGAHNPASISALIKTVSRLFKNEPKTLLFACMQDKDYETMVKLLRPHFQSVVVTRLDHRRAACSAELAKLFDPNQLAAAEDDVRKALCTAREIASKNGSLLVVCGSFYLAGEIISLI